MINFTLNIIRNSIPFKNNYQEFTICFEEQYKKPNIKKLEINKRISFKRFNNSKIFPLFFSYISFLKQKILNGINILAEYKFNKNSKIQKFQIFASEIEFLKSKHKKNMKRNHKINYKEKHFNENTKNDEKEYEKDIFFSDLKNKLLFLTSEKMVLD